MVKQVLCRIRFKLDCDASLIKKLKDLPGLSLCGRPDSRTLLLELTGDMDALIKTLSQWPVEDFETERPGLEDAFMAYYREGRE